MRSKFMRQCPQCGSLFSRPPSIPQIYCSRACRAAAQRAGITERFWAKVDKSGECWLWTASVGTSGYGQIGIGGRLGRPVQAHRVAYELTFGPIPPGLAVCHRCDVKLCVRPDHLFLGTHADNMIDMVRKGRHFSKMTPGRIVTGDRHGMAKLTAEQVVEIHHAYTACGMRQHELASQYNVSQATISRVVLGKNWRQ